MKTKHELKNIMVKFNSVLLGIALILNFLVGAVNDFISVTNLFPICIFIIGSSMFISKLYHKQVSLKIPLNIFAFLLLFLVQIVLSFFIVNSDMTIYYAQCFFLVGIPSIYIALQEKDIVIVRHVVLILSILCFQHFLKILTSEYTIYTAGEQMGNAYAILPIFFITIWTVLDTNDNLKWKIIATIDAIMCFLILVKVMTRGAWLCVLIFLLFIMCRKFINKKSFIMIMIVTPILIILGFYLFNSYLVNTEWYYNIFSMKSSDILNGRDILLKKVLVNRGFFPILFGSGIGSFYAEYKTYPHNIIAQLYFDQGIITVFIVISIFVVYGKGMIKNALKNYDSDYLLVMIICAGLIKLMVSYYFWIEQLFWIMIGLLFERYNKNNYIS